MAFRSRVAAYSSAGASFFPQGLTLVSHCSQRLVAWLPAAGTPHTRVRPWKERHRLTEKGALPIDLPGHPCDPTGTRADDGLDAGTASYPRGVLRGERPKRVLVPFARSKGTPSGQRPHQAGKPKPWAVRTSTPQSASQTAPLAQGSLWAWQRYGAQAEAGKPETGAVRRSIPPTRRCGLCIPRLAPERRGKSRSRRRTSSPRTREALVGQRLRQNSRCPAFSSLVY